MMMMTKKIIITLWYFSDQIESIQKRALKIIFPSLCYGRA